MPDTVPLLEVRNLSKSYPLRGGFFDIAKGAVRAVDRVSFSIARGQTFGLVGESGCGKTTTARMIVRVVEPDAGEIAFWDQELGLIDLCKLSGRKMRPLRRKIQMIFQDPYASLDPRHDGSADRGGAAARHGLNGPARHARACRRGIGTGGPAVRIHEPLSARL